MVGIVLLGVVDVVVGLVAGCLVVAVVGLAVGIVFFKGTAFFGCVTGVLMVGLVVV